MQVISFHKSTVDATAAIVDATAAIVDATAAIDAAVALSIEAHEIFKTLSSMDQFYADEDNLAETKKAKDLWIMASERANAAIEHKRKIDSTTYYRLQCFNYKGKFDVLPNAQRDYMHSMVGKFILKGDPNGNVYVIKDKQLMPRSALMAYIIRRSKDMYELSTWVWT